MTDLEMTKLCAEAMGYTVSTDRLSRAVAGELGVWTHEHGNYYPLHSDAQAMALVKRFPVTCIDALDMLIPHGPLNDDDVDLQNLDLNRAIVETVAKMRAAKAGLVTP